MAGEITLTRATVDLTSPSNKCRKNWALKVTAESTFDELDSSIFVYHAADDSDPIQGDTFSNVASLQDMESLPKDAPTAVDDESTDDYVPYYRVSEIALDFYDLVELERAWTVIKHDTDRLVKEYKASLDLSQTETYIAS